MTSIAKAMRPWTELACQTHSASPTTLSGVDWKSGSRRSAMVGVSTAKMLGARPIESG